MELICLQSAVDPLSTANWGMSKLPHCWYDANMAETNRDQTPVSEAVVAERLVFGPCLVDDSKHNVQITYCG